LTQIYAPTWESYFVPVPKRFCSRGGEEGAKGRRSGAGGQRATGADTRSIYIFDPNEVSSLNCMVDSGQLTNVQNAIDLASLNFMVNRNFQMF
jgi:hypothetical protein